MAIIPTEKSSSMPLRDKSSTKVVINYPDADIILRSSDSSDFRLQKLFITKSSSPLNGRIQAASRLSDANPGKSLPVVHLSETSRILHSLLTFVLPLSPTLPSTLEETMELLSVAQKYEMSHVLVHIRGSVALKDPPFINKTNAPRVYSLAQKYGLYREMVQAARITLKSTLTIENLQDRLSLDLMSGDHLHELWKYHQRVQANLVKNVTEFIGSDACTALNGVGCVNISSFKIPKWIEGYIVSTASAPSMFDFTEFQSALARHASGTSSTTGGRGCSFCANLPEEKIDEYWMTLSTFVHKNMEIVSIILMDHVI
jgi:hypothetical protein